MFCSARKLAISTLALLVWLFRCGALPVAADNIIRDRAVGKEDDVSKQPPLSINRDMCGFDPPKSYCGFCDSYYLKTDDDEEGGCDKNECTYHCSNSVRCSSNPSDYCPGYCCKDFGCTIFGCKDKCDYYAVGCNGICCERRDEVSQDFWDKAQEKAAQWFLRRASKFFLGGCGFLCQGFIEFLFAPRKAAMTMSVDCWKLPNQTAVPRTAPRDSDYPALDDTLLTSDIDLGAVEQRKEAFNVLANKIRERAWKSAELESAFVVKLKIPSQHSAFMAGGSDGGVYWIENWAKQLYDEFSGCNDCCGCAINEATCLDKCSKDVNVHFNYNIKDYEWPDWSYDMAKHEEERNRYVAWNTPKGYYYNNSLLFKELDFSHSDGGGDAVATLPLFGRDSYEGVLVGCHVYPYAWKNGASISFSLPYFSCFLCMFSSLLLWTLV